MYRSSVFASRRRSDFPSVAGMRRAGELVASAGGSSKWSFARHTYPRAGDVVRDVVELPVRWPAGVAQDAEDRARIADRFLITSRGDDRDSDERGFRELFEQPCALHSAELADAGQPSRCPVITAASVAAKRSFQRMAAGLVRRATTRKKLSRRIFDIHPTSVRRISHHLDSDASAASV
jgi:hypothetical protein